MRKEVRFVVYVNAWPRVWIVSGDQIKQWAPFARIHTTLCGEWTQGGHECPGGHWLGPFSYEEAMHAARATGLPMVRCNRMLNFLKGEVTGKPGYKPQDLHLLAVEGCRLRTILRYPSGMDVIFEYLVILERGQNEFLIGELYGIAYQITDGGIFSDELE